MTKNYFSLDDDFDKIIKRELKDKEILEMNQITTGWTNIVYEVKTTDGNYFFRFPRDDFWIRTIVKDYEFAKFIYGKTDFETVRLNLSYDDGRPFSIHKKIEGTVLASKMDNMTDAEIDTVSQDIAKFMYQLHNIKFDNSEIFDINNIGLDLVDFLDELLNVHVSKEDMKFWKYDEFKNKKHNLLVHGDLNSSNIILDENNHISAVIDFGFGGFGNKYFDIARIIGRCPEKFKNPIMKHYEEMEGKNLDYTILDDEIDIWNKIDSAYINYMRSIGIYK